MRIDEYDLKLGSLRWTRQVNGQVLERNLHSMGAVLAALRANDWLQFGVPYELSNNGGYWVLATFASEEDAVMAALAQQVFDWSW